VCWTDETLSRQHRSLINLGMLAALGRMEEFELHFRGALRNGLSQAELRAALIQITIYCGVPAGVECFRIARRVLDSEAPSG
jgi:4-carboxymuconolactone decarboxylase